MDATRKRTNSPSLAAPVIRLREKVETDTIQPDLQGAESKGGLRSPEVSLPNKVYATIINSILRGDFQKEGKLPTEAELAERFGVSRPTVREALSRLRSDGIISSRRGSGSYIVRMPDMNARHLTPIESIEDIQHYYDFRMCVESGAAGLAASMRTEQDLESIQAAYSDLEKAMKGGQPAVEEDLRFHLAIANASHNKFFISTIEFIVGPIRQCMELAHNLFPAKTHERINQTQNEHLAIVEAIVERSSDEAAEAMRLHVLNARRRIFKGV